ncbi:MAG TPA: acyl carrier protein [Candidatus Sulfotelmatobacter sp.]|nr:acyl carrier protein [Candidatus Sulfotelmatobacter sp.]
MQSNFVGEVRSFVVTNYLLGREEGLGNDDSFQDQGIIDSTGILELVSHLERTYGIEILDQELNPDNLDSVNKIAAYLTRKLSTVTDHPITRERGAFAR